LRTCLLVLSVPVLVSCSRSSSSGASEGDLGGSADSGVVADGGVLEDCALSEFDASAYILDGATGPIGTPCVLFEEEDPLFTGSYYVSVSTSTIPASGSEVCFAYHFQGLVTCPYGQSADGQAPACASPCLTTKGQPVVGSVLPWCSDRPASEAVIWSCRCANAHGATNDGQTYCTCPSDAPCTQAIAGIGDAEDDYSGAYCLPPATANNPATQCGSVCDPVTNPCN
jgi:hypothetical protein